MKIFGFKHPITVELVLLCSGLMLILAIELWSLSLPPETPVPLLQKSETPASVKDDFSLPPPDHYQEIVERSLFSQTRRPVAPQDSASSTLAEKKTQLDSYSLTAVIITPNQRLALLRGVSDKKIHRFEEGQEMQGWTLKQIKSESAIFYREGEQQELRLLRRTPQQFKLAKPRVAIPPPKPQAQASTQQSQNVRQSQNVPPSSQDQGPKSSKGTSKN